MQNGSTRAFAEPSAAGTPVASRPPLSPRQEALLETAMALFLQRGMSTTMDAVAAAARMSKRTLYSFYGNKMELFVGVLEWLSAEKTEAALSLPPELPIEEALRRYGWALYDHYATPKIANFLRLMQKEKERIPDLDRVMREETVREQVLPLRAYLDAQPRGRLRQVDTFRAALAFVRNVIGEISDGYARSAAPERAAFAPFLDEAVDLFVGGIREAG